MLACRLMTKILGETSRQIITNLPLNIPEIRDYMDEHWPTAAPIRNRITLITNTKLLKHFWLTLGNDWWIPDVSKERWNLGERLDYSIAYRWKETTKSTRRRKHITDLDKDEIESLLNEPDPPLEYCDVSTLSPCQFIIDELQNIFPSRAFMQTSHGALFWLSQQRKLGADFIGITQNADLIDKEFRDLADDFLFITNWGRKQKSWFRLPKVMTWSKYDTKPGPGVKPMVTGYFQQDIKGMGKLYDTSAGVGIEGGLSADTKEIVPGIHWGWFVLIFALCIYGLTFVPGCAHKIGTKALQAKPRMDLGLASQPLDNSKSHFNHTEKNSTLVKVPTSDNELAGLCFINGTWTAIFADNTEVKSTDPEWNNLLIRAKKPVGARIEGTNYYLVRPGAPRPHAPMPPSALDPH